MLFSLSSKSSDCGVIFYDSKSGKEIKRIPFEEKDRIGFVYRRDIDIDDKETAYMFWQNDKIMPDFFAKSYVKQKEFGKKRTIEDFKARCFLKQFDWENDKRPLLSYSEVLLYVMHVRGFTMHSSSKVKNKGTFAGIQEKIPYLKEIGVTSIELQPAYEFTEIPSDYEDKAEGYYKLPEELQEKKNNKLNYWGYKEGFYYAPKAAYSSNDDASYEFKCLVKELHRNGMELIMQFYFPDTVQKNRIADILHFWVEEYHVDGFHIMGDNLPIDLLANDEFLADSKLFFYDFNFDKIYAPKEYPIYPHLAVYNDAYMIDMRRFLKGDEGMLNAALYHMSHIPEKAGRIHYFSNYYGFSLMDMVSFDHKHNEANEENNHDGMDYNCSWNCGEEGPTRSKKIKRLRMQQLKNAMCMLLFSQSTPLISMGDEFGKTQKGNNNPYCQDNAIAWLDWSLLQKNREIFDFWKMLVELRKEHCILHPERQLTMNDTLSCGYPDLSYHGENAWRPLTESYSRHIGLMYCEKYAREAAEGFLYIAMNMHWDMHKVALPKLPQNMKWQLCFQTVESGEKENALISGDIINEIGIGNIIDISPRCIQVYKSIKIDTNQKKSRKTVG